MPCAVKAPLRQLDSLRWAQSAATGARIDLTRSTVPADDDGEAPGESPIHDDTPVRAAIATRYGVDPEEVVLSPAFELALTQAILAFVRTGEHVIVERPSPELAHRLPELLGASVSRCERRFEEGWAIAPDQLTRLLSPRTRAVVLGNLHCPTGVGWTTEIAVATAALAARVGARIIVDERLLESEYEAGPTPPAASTLADNMVSLSCAEAALGGSRLGLAWLVTRDREALAALRAAGEILFGGTLPAVVLGRALHAFDGAGARAEAVRRRLASVRRVVERWLAAEGRVACVEPTRTFLTTIRLPEFLHESTFVAHLRGRYDTQVIPGSMYEAPGHVILGLAGPTSDLEQGLANFSAALDDLR
jgi:aspartate/methionine/tyrosine aminotransferase